MDLKSAGWFSKGLGGAYGCALDWVVPTDARWIGWCLEMCAGLGGAYGCAPDWVVPRDVRWIG